MRDHDITSWLTPSELETIYSSKYWNSIDNEKEKPWWIENGNFEKCLRYLDSSGLMKEFLQAEALMKNLGGHNLAVADLAAGIGWTTAMLSKNPQVKEIHAVEISQHRMEKLFPQCMKMLGGIESKVFRYIGSFYDLKLPPESIDLVFMSQAFHHADQPNLLLESCSRILKKGGLMVIVGEHYIGPVQFFKRFFTTLLRKGQLVVNFSQLFPPDSDSGDHFYRIRDYKKMFLLNGFSLLFKKNCSDKLTLIANKIEVPQPLPCKAFIP